MQLQNLCSLRLNVEEDLVNELGKLPEDLADTYTKIFEHVGRLAHQSRIIAERSLRWLLCQARELSEAEFLAAVSIGTEREFSNLTKETILFICGNLVTFDHELRIFRFAHLSVREYLETQPNFTLGAAHTLAAETSLLVCLQRHTELGSKCKFRRYAILYWLYHCQEAKKSGLSGRLYRLLEDFLHTREGTNLIYANWVRAVQRLWRASEDDSDGWKWESDDESCDRTDDDLINGTLRKWRLGLVTWRSAETDRVDDIILSSILGDRDYPYDPIYAACYLDLPCIVEQNLRSVLSNPAEKVGDLAIIDTNVFERWNVKHQIYLHMACHSESSKLLHLLLQYRSSVHSKDSSHRTALHYAANPHGLVLSNAPRQTGAVCVADGQAIPAERVAMIGLLIEKGSIIDAADIAGETALHRASRASFCTQAQCLLEYGAFVDAKTNVDQTPLHLAAELGHTVVARILLQFKANIEARDESGRTPLLQAAQSGHTAVTQLLPQSKAEIETRDPGGDTPLHKAVKLGCTTITRLLLQFKANTEARGLCQRTPLLLAAYLGHTTIVELLLEFKANTEARDWDQRTPLLLAADLGHTGIVQLLLQSKAHIEAKDECGRTPLFLTAMKGNIDIGRLLLRLGADINAKDSGDETTLAGSLLMRQEAMAQMLIDEGASLGKPDWSGHTLLHHAARSRLQATIPRLLKMGANTNQTNVRGSTPLHLAIKPHNGSRAEYGNNEAFRIVQLLVDAEANIEMSDDEGQTPLHLAAQMADEASIQILLDRGANIKAEDNEGLLPLDHAALSGSLQFFSYMFKLWSDVMAESSECAVETWLRLAAKPVDNVKLGNFQSFDFLQEWRNMSIEDLVESTTPGSSFQKIWDEKGPTEVSTRYRARRIVREMRARCEAQIVI